MHKPWYTLKTKSGHPPLKEMRSTFQPLFDEAEVDFVLSRHIIIFKHGFPWFMKRLPNLPRIQMDRMTFQSPMVNSILLTVRFVTKLINPRKMEQEQQSNFAN